MLNLQTKNVGPGWRPKKETHERKWTLFYASKNSNIVGVGNLLNYFIHK